LYKNRLNLLLSDLGLLDCTLSLGRLLGLWLVCLGEPRVWIFDVIVRKGVHRVEICGHKPLTWTYHGQLSLINPVFKRFNLLIYTGSRRRLRIMVRNRYSGNRRYSLSRVSFHHLLIQNACLWIHVLEASRYRLLSLWCLHFRLRLFLHKVLDPIELRFFFIKNDLIRQVSRNVKSPVVLVLERRQRLI
jgi:hypothetical protein